MTKKFGLTFSVGDTALGFDQYSARHLESMILNIIFSVVRKLHTRD